MDTEYILPEVNDTLIHAAMNWLEKEIDKHSGPKFIVSHYPVYSTGFFGSYKTFSLKMEEFLDAHNNSQIVAVISGHDHIFSSFRRNN